MMKERKIFQLVTSSDICLTYELLHRRGLVSFPVTSDGRNKIGAIVESINSEYFGRAIYHSLEEKTVAYLYFLIKDHPFVDGNKRTASLVFESICALNGLKPNYGDFSLDSLAVFVEKIKEEDHQNTIKKIAEVLFRKEGR